MKSTVLGFAAALLLSSMAHAEPPDAAKAKAAFQERQAICDADAGKLWGRSLCGPILFIDPESRGLVASQAAPDLEAQDGVFVGKLPEGMGIANTASDWAGVRWTMVMWPLPEDALERRALLMHESFHSVQEALGLPMRSYAPAHLAMLEGRVGLRLGSAPWPRRSRRRMRRAPGPPSPTPWLSANAAARRPAKGPSRSASWS